MATSPQSSPGLLRALGPWTATAIVAGTIIGSGVFKKPSSIAESVPGFDLIALVWVLGGVLSLLGALSLAEVSVLFPKAGGNYVFLREGFGRAAGFLWGWVEFWIIRSASLAALATIFVESLHDILREAYGVTSQADVLSFWDQRLVTVGVLVILALVNARGVRWGGGLQFFITLIKVGSLLAILLLPFLFWGKVTERPENPPGSLPAFTWAGLGTAFLGVLWAYHGWMNIAPVAGEVNQPQRNIPIAFLAGVGIVIFLYLGANLAYQLVLSQAEIKALQDTSTTTVAAFANRLLGPVGTLLASGAVMCSVFGALNGNLLVGPRLLYAMGEDGLAPRALSHVHARYRTPVQAIFVLTGWALLLVLGAAVVHQLELSPTKKPIFDFLTDYAMFGAVIFETLAVATIFVFRNKLPDADRPYRCWGYPVVPLLYFLLPACLIVNYFVNQRLEAAIGVVFIGLGALVYVLVFARSSENTT
ncbi:MAG: amino acid permease [Gemmataceae bacterium]|nr:amino acid permease [Gemmataceae bacterium]